jgi:hypothetical protein
VSPEVRSFIKTLSNQCWGSDTGRIKGMRRIAIAQLGTAGTLDEQQFAENLSKLAITKLIPKVFRLMAETISEEPHKSKILEAASRCESEWTAEAALAASQAAEAAGELGSPISEAGSAAWSAMYSLKYDRVSAVIGSVAHAVYCATVAVVERHFHGFVGRSDADKTAAHADAMRDSELLLSEFTEAVVQILVEMKTPGSQFLFLTGAPGCGKNHFPETYCSHL